MKKKVTLPKITISELLCGSSPEQVRSTISRLIEENNASMEAINAQALVANSFPITLTAFHLKTLIIQQFLLDMKDGGSTRTGGALMTTSIHYLTKPNANG